MREVGSKTSRSELLHAGGWLVGTLTVREVWGAWPAQTDPKEQQLEQHLCCVPEKIMWFFVTTMGNQMFKWRVVWDVRPMANVHTPSQIYIGLCKILKNRHIGLIGLKIGFIGMERLKSRQIGFIDIWQVNRKAWWNPGDSPTFNVDLA